MSDESLHRKRLAQILRYIAGMYESAENTNGPVFVREARDNADKSAFFSMENEIRDDDSGSWGILFTTDHFRHLIEMECAERGGSLFMSPPFTFYAAASGTVSSRPNPTEAEKWCWLRITRVSAAQMPPRPSYRSSPVVQQYLENWKERVPGVQSVEQLLSLDNLQHAPDPLQPTVKSFLRKMRKYQQKDLYRRTLEPVYNRLFQWLQTDAAQHDALVWGLGQACYRDHSEDGGDVLVNGPILEVQMEVELARDGAILLRPRQHTGVTLNRDVLSRLGSSEKVLSAWHQRVAELEASQLAPGQPATYIPMLKAMAVELSAGGSFRLSSSLPQLEAELVAGNLVVTEAWCLYSRPKPSGVWARDAMTFADRILSNSTKVMELPIAAWSITHGPAALHGKNVSKDKNTSSRPSYMDWLPLNMFRSTHNPPDPPTFERPLFPLPTSVAQDRIADLLIAKLQPAVVCCGPPGTGKTHSIANILCAYLCQGKRVLVTSKNAPALSVLRERLPPTVQELCVDVSCSELSGMRQLQKTVERLADRVSSVSGALEETRRDYLKATIQQLQAELTIIDQQLQSNSGNIRSIVTHPDGVKFVEKSLALIEAAPWLMSSIANWKIHEVMMLRDKVSLLVPEGVEALEKVTGFETPPSNTLLLVVASRAGSINGHLQYFGRTAIALLPLVGTLSGFETDIDQAKEAMRSLRIDGMIPKSKSDWNVVLRALRLAQQRQEFWLEVWNANVRLNKWPADPFPSSFRPLQTLRDVLNDAVELKDLELKTKVRERVRDAEECRKLDLRRSVITSQLQDRVVELVNSTVVSEISKSFSVEAQSALISFAQIAGKAKFSRSSLPAKMTQRQRRHRQEYLEAFDKCCRFIPCWILTNSQISEYLPSECLFDLVIIDEASQSDVSVLPGMLRGKQWLIVGDGKQVSPTECFVSEEHIDNLRAALPTSPLQSSLLPGHSFFDLCSQAFPSGRVVLREHFRCAPEIISFSNSHFYDSALVPLRVPTRSERISPSIIDVKMPDGKKIGKVNEAEADEIVRRIKHIVTQPNSTGRPRSIGVISLLGNEQSRLIRGRLLDVIGPQLMSQHDILVGDPPSFQGAERDIVFLSMVCSQGSVPTQNQLMHFQRANVALSRARDQCILVRSLELHHIPNSEDMKIPIIEFFKCNSTKGQDAECASSLPDHALGFGYPIQAFALKTLRQFGFSVRGMGDVLKNGICVEDGLFDARAALFIECTGETVDEWQSVYMQQKAIERVGWKCLRVDALSLVSDFSSVVQSIIQFLHSVGIHEAAVVQNETEIDESAEDEQEGIEDQIHARDMEVVEEGADDMDAALDNVELVVALDADDNNNPNVVVISSDDEEECDRKIPAVRPDLARSETLMMHDDTLPAAQFGQVVNDLGFLRGTSAASARFPSPGLLRRRKRNDATERDEDITWEDFATSSHRGRRYPVAKRKRTTNSNDDDSSLSDTEYGDQPSLETLQQMKADD